MQTRFLHFLHGAFFLVTAVAGVAAEDSLVQYNRDVRPILADRCFRCHGPDGAAREAELSLDRRADAIADRDGQRAIEPGMPTTSALMRRITSADPDVRMPPPESGAELSDHDVEVLRRWIADGATYDQHWSFVAPVRPVPPETTDPAWAENAIDRFVIARLKRGGMVPSPEATPATVAVHFAHSRISRRFVDGSGIGMLNQLTGFACDAMNSFLCCLRS
jgi:mono/diheme cytochrome c family protein